MDSDDLVSARLRSVLPDTAPPPRPAAEPDLVPADPERRGEAWSSLPYAWDTAALPAIRNATDDDPERLHSGGATGATAAPTSPLSGSGAFGDRRLSIFDPGRRGVRALAAVAAVVVVVAALLAWRSRPRVEPVAEPPAAVPAPTTPGGGPGLVRASAAQVVVAVAGKVRRPGLVRLPSGSRVADAIQAAGGASAGVDVTMLNPARKVVDGELIVVGVPAPSGAAITAAGAGPAAPRAPGAPVNLNTATLADLDSLPGVGPVLAQRILDARTAQGGFAAVSDLRKVDGIGDARYEQLKDLVVV
jgi:competence protein ComEA